MSENANLALWDAVEKTDPKHTKPITGKSYQGTSPKPHFLVHKATETFGPIGIGWGFNIVSERIEEGAGGERMHIAHLRVWYVWDGKRGEVEHIGGTQFSGMRSTGKPFTDDDAPKKSVTDALVKALSMIGFAGDIFMGRFDDSKYVNDLKREFAEEADAPRDDAPKVLVKDQRLIDAELRAEINACGTVEELERLKRTELFKTEFRKLKPDWQEALIEMFNETVADRQAAPAVTPRGYVEPVFPQQ